MRQDDAGLTAGLTALKPSHTALVKMLKKKINKSHNSHQLWSKWSRWAAVNELIQPHIIIIMTVVIPAGSSFLPPPPPLLCGSGAVGLFNIL